MGVPNGPTGCRLRHPLHSRLNPLPLLVKLVLWSRRTPKCHIGAQCTVGPTRRLNIREECCLQAKRTTEKVVMPSCYTMVVSRTWRGMLHDNMVTMWVHISERGRPGAAPSQVMLMEARRHQVAHSSATAVTTNCLVQLRVSKCIVLETKAQEHFSCNGSLKSLFCASVRILTASRGTPAN